MDKKVSKTRVRKALLLLAILGIVGSAIVWNLYVQTNGVPTISRPLYWGSSGQDVKNLQWKLSQWGIYNGLIDGDFGKATWDAVKKFQDNNGLAADGVAGQTTLTKLGLWTGSAGGSRALQSVATTRGVDRRGDVTLLAKAIHAEAGAEPYQGQVAVGAVILNRVESSLFPNTISGVIYQPLAFESVANGIINRPPDAEALKAAQDCLNGYDPTYGALFFWNPSKKVSAWIWSRKIVMKIGQHVFAL